VQVGGGRRRQGGEGGARATANGGIATDEHVEVDESHGMQQHTQHAAVLLLDDPHPSSLMMKNWRKGRSSTTFKFAVIYRFHFQHAT
jgi:hypothetical protein